MPKKINSFKNISAKILEELKYYTIMYNKKYEEDYKKYEDKLMISFFGKDVKKGKSNYYKRLKSEKEREEKNKRDKEDIKHKENKDIILSIINGKLPSNALISAPDFGSLFECKSKHSQVVQTVIKKDRKEGGIKDYVGFISFPIVDIDVKTDKGSLEYNLTFDYRIRATRKAFGDNNYGYFTGDEYESEIKKYFNNLFKSNKKEFDKMLNYYVYKYAIKRLPLINPKDLEGKTPIMSYKLRGNDY